MHEQDHRRVRVTLPEVVDAQRAALGICDLDVVGREVESRQAGEPFIGRTQRFH